MTQGEFFGYVIDILENLKIPYMVIGSVASIAYSKARLTLDMDIVLDISPSQAKQLVENFGEDYHADLQAMLEAISTRGHFNIIHIPSASKVDFYLLKHDAFSNEEFNHRKKIAFDDNRDAYFARPEDVILGKLDFYKEGKSHKHLEDIRKIVEILKDNLDIPYIERWAKKKGTADIWFGILKEAQDVK